jgi:hypothetical protein
MAARSRWTIHVKTLAGEKATLQLEQDVFDRPVAELVEAACHEIGIVILIYGNYNVTLLVPMHSCLKGGF